VVPRIDAVAPGPLASTHMARDLVSEAKQAQLTTGYRADLWIETKLEPMTKLWQGKGGKSNFFLSEEDAREARGAYDGTIPYRFAQTLWRLAQVQPNPTLGFRDTILEFVVDLEIRVAMGVCQANTALGSGSVLQYYIPDWEPRLHETGRRFTFDAKGFPSLSAR
jgi:hypothetical protein